ncbi:transporter substrate-binding domain-containing protein [Pseudogemmobacter sonorensis]|uniref:transporter substrate-binding domain-containing protein n=1 Tax=Pseudogemmobacter sonorensis TaxID=2989681 RepID=UPI00367DFAFE
MKEISGVSRRCAFAAAALFALGSAALAESDPELVAKLPDSVKSSKTIRVGSPMTIPPHVYLEGQQLTGVAVDLSRALEPMLDVTFEFRDMQWPGIIPGLQSGAIDVSMGMISFREDRKEILNMIPYVNDALSLLIASENTEITGDEKTLCGKRVGVVQASWFYDLAEGASARCVEGGLPAVEVLQYSGNPGVLAAFQSRSIDAWVHTALELSAVERALDGTARIVNMEGDNWATGAITISTGKDQLALAEVLQAGLNKLIADGSYQSILEKHAVGTMGVETFSINP